MLKHTVPGENKQYLCNVTKGTNISQACGHTTMLLLTLPCIITFQKTKASVLAGGYKQSSEYAVLWRTKEVFSIMNNCAGWSTKV